jgi:hypothetical protein
LQVFSDLAYGAQGIQYFTYWTPYDTVWKFNNAPVSLEGKRTDSYDRVKQMNEEIKSLSYVFLGAKVITIAHTGNPVPTGTKPLSGLPSPVKELSTEGSGAVVSVLKNRKDNYLVVVNRDFLKPMKLTIECDKDVYKINKDGSKVAADVYQKTLEIEPGDIAIYGWNDK